MNKTPHSIIIVCLFSIANASFPPLDLTMVNIFAGRFIQLEQYQQSISLPINSQIVSSNNLGILINPFYTPFWKLGIPLDVYLGYEFSISDNQTIVQTATEQLVHMYSCHYISGGLSLNLLPFADVSVYGGYGLAYDNFTDYNGGMRFDYINTHPQMYIMPGLEFLYLFKNSNLFLKLGFYAKKELSKAWDLNAVTAGGFYLIDHTSGQIGARLTIGYGRAPKKASQSLSDKQNVKSEKPDTTASAVIKEPQPRNSVKGSEQSTNSMDTTTGIKKNIQAITDNVPIKENATSNKPQAQSNTGLSEHTITETSIITKKRINTSNQPAVPQSKISNEAVSAPGLRPTDLSPNEIAAMIDTLVDTFYLKNGQIKTALFSGFNGDLIVISVFQPDGTMGIKQIPCSDFKSVKLSSGQEIDSNCNITQSWYSKEAAEEKKNKMVLAGEYSRKTIVLLPYVVGTSLKAETNLFLHPTLKSSLLLTFYKHLTSLTRYDILIPDSSCFLSFIDTFGIYIKEKGTVKSALLKSIQATIAPRLLKALSFVADKNALRYLSEQQRNSFITDKAKESGLTTAEISLALNNGYIAVPLFGNSTGMLIQLGLLVCHVTVSSDNKRQIDIDYLDFKTGKIGGFGEGTLRDLKITFFGFFRDIGDFYKTTIIDPVKSIFNKNYSDTAKIHSTNKKDLPQKEVHSNFEDACDVALSMIMNDLRRLPDFGLVYQTEFDSKGKVSININCQEERDISVDDYFSFFLWKENKSNNHLEEDRIGWGQVDRKPDRGCDSTQGTRARLRVISGQAPIGSLAHEIPTTPFFFNTGLHLINPKIQDVRTIMVGFSFGLGVNKLFGFSHTDFELGLVPYLNANINSQSEVLLDFYLRIGKGFSYKRIIVETSLAAGLAMSGDAPWQIKSSDSTKDLSVSPLFLEPSIQANFLISSIMLFKAGLGWRIASETNGASVSGLTGELSLHIDLMAIHEIGDKIQKALGHTKDDDKETEELNKSEYGF